MPKFLRTFGKQSLSSIGVKWTAIAITLTTICFAGQVIGDARVADSPLLRCDTGPLNMTYGRTQWLVYSCSDGRSLVVVSAPGNPAMPFYFVITLNKKGYRIVGEGTGRKEVTSAALKDLKKLSEREIKSLIERTKQR